MENASGPWNRMKNPRVSAEAGMIRSEENIPFDTLVELSMKQAERDLMVSRLVAVLQPHRTRAGVLEGEELKGFCTRLARENSFLMPDHIEDEKERAAYIAALFKAMSAAGAESN